MACKYKSRVLDNGWCKVACMYCTLTQEMNCKHNKKTNADRIRAMSDMELAQWMASRIADLKFLDIEMSGKQLTTIEKAALTHDLYVVFGRYLQQPAEEET